MNGLDLFSGIGGIGLGLEPWVRTVAYCERDRYAQSVLLSRMQQGEIDKAPIWDDVTTLRGDMLPRIDIIFGGFPCQDLSIAKQNRKGLDGERSGLFYEIIRLVKEISPSFVFLENVPAIRTNGLLDVVSAFTEIGYDCRWTCLSASDVGAKHKRERWFLLAHPQRKRRITGTNELTHSFDGRTPDQLGDSSEASRTVADSEFSGSQGRLSVWESEEREGEQGHTGRSSTSLSTGGTTESRPNLSEEFWTVEPSVDRVVDGLPYRMDRIKCLGNSVVPLQIREAFKKLSGLT